ncbi:carbohydrate ABC transporter substrate-binding protein, CUT1 family [Actinomadura madurae]|uniref:Carbohydrate ABC transporter substrate-binding protein, CUT1 family n=1 Tax=Actinomadura madurae TaxID=1993 RepID=A0A1I4WKP1_9ACTN|nr:extracellular solute-binding protein [Actinomadura madurae]SFN14361.1 carbohydrate ABC transporter substrate-binding protein, CUT1 family [Actinomadura madurae]
MRPRILATLTMLTAVLGATAAGCGGDGSDAKDTAPLDAGTKVSITVGCMPAKSQAAQRKEWNEDAAAFQKLHPNITVEGKDAFPCIDPQTFQAKLAGGQMEDVFYVYFTDVRNIVAHGQAADITPYLGQVKQYGNLDPAVMKVFKDADKVYGLPRQNYTMGLFYNRKLFEKAGLNPDAPPKTWAEVRDAAKKISALGDGVVGYAELSAKNQGGWHFTTSLYSQGGSMVSPDGRKSAFNGPQGRAVLQNLKDMRWTDDSMGGKQLLVDADIQRMMAAGKLGMYLGAPDNATALVDQFKGDYEDYGMGPIPGATGTLLGGDGYMINPKASPEKIKAGLMWLDFAMITPGRGQLNYARAAKDGRPVGLPQPKLFGQNATGQKDRDLRAASANLPVRNFKPYEDAYPSVPGKLEPPQAQQLYAILDSAVSAVLTRRDANIDQLLADAQKKADAALARSGS